MSEKKTKENRQFLGIWIPREIYLNHDLSWTDKILVIEINSLDNERGCFASNDYFAEFLGVTKTTISTSISKLKKLGFIEQISFDGRTRILKAAFNNSEKQHTRKLKGSVQENLKHNNTDNNTSNNSLEKEKKYIKKDLEVLSDNPKLKNQVNTIISNAVCIQVDELKNESSWVEHCSRYLLLNPHFTNKLLQQFIDEQKLKEDNFKSIKETKSHFINWAKIEVSKNRKFGNDHWGKSAPKQKVQNTQFVNEESKISEEEAKRLRKHFLKENLIKPYQSFCDDGILQVSNLGGLIFKELKKFDLLIKDKTKIYELEKEIQNAKEKKANGRGSRALMELIGNNSDFEDEMIKLSLAKLKEQNINLSEKLKL